MVEVCDSVEIREGEPDSDIWNEGSWTTTFLFMCKGSYAEGGATGVR